MHILLIIMILALGALFIVAGVAPLMISIGVVVTMAIIVGGGMWLIFGRHENTNNQDFMEGRSSSQSSVESDNHR